VQLQRLLFTQVLLRAHSLKVLGTNALVPLDLFVQVVFGDHFQMFRLQMLSAIQ
jgi:hypothetical protein